MDNTRQTTSLLPHCIPCRSHCCRYSSPILDQDERDKIVALTGKDYFERIVTGDGVYYVVGRKSDGSRRTIALDENGRGDPCTFLSADGHCSIHEIKPLDCAAYPIRAVPMENGELSWHLHRSCPAAPSLSSAFVRRAKQIAEASARRFTPVAYTHWLRHFSQWTLLSGSVLKRPPSGESWDSER
jgi:Fe-S-cluster containining protein